MKIDIEKISEDESILISDYEKDIIRKSRKNYVSGEDKGISIDKSYSNFLNNFNNLK